MTSDFEHVMAGAKRRFSEAARASLAADPGAPELARAALEEVARARAVSGDDGDNAKSVSAIVSKSHGRATCGGRG